MPLELLITLPDGEQETRNLPADVGVIGRSRKCFISIADASVSARHAIIENAPDGLFILDLGSTNGIRADGKRVIRERIVPGRVFQLGRLLLEARPVGGIDAKSPFAPSLADVPHGPIAARVTASPTRLARIRAVTNAGLRTAQSSGTPQKDAALAVGKWTEEQLAALRNRAKQVQKKESPSLAAVIKRSPLWVVSLMVHAAVIAAVGMLAIATDTIPKSIIIALRLPEPPPDPLWLEDIPTLEPKEIELDPVPEDSPYIDESTADHLESSDDDIFNEFKGEDPDFLAWKPLGGASWNTTMGTGTGGLGGAFGGRLGGKMNLVVRGGGSRETQAAVMAGLKWLARHQQQDGSWGVYGPNLGCADESCGTGGGFETGLTGLALLAFLGSGFTPSSTEKCDGISLGKVVGSGLSWLVSHQTESGSFGQDGISMYEQAIGTMALAEAYALTGRIQYRAPASRAVRFVIEAQNPYAGWRYRRKCNDNDTSVTGWCVMALKSASLAGLDVGKTSFEWAKSFLDTVTETTGYGKIKIGYCRLGSSVTCCTPNGGNAIGLVLKLYLEDKPGTSQMNSLAESILLELPDPESIINRSGSPDYYYWYYATLGLFLYDGPDSGRPGTYWKKWNERMIATLTETQHKKEEGCCYGSWDPVDRWSGSGGRVYATALNTLTLEVYYRYPSVFTGTDRKK
ncbi:MAG: FHA domain-containing protein [Planctomycetota bacterium]|nr:FHA domain-containing protein [Planctomycetota bacterium]